MGAVNRILERTIYTINHRAISVSWIPTLNIQAVFNIALAVSSTDIHTFLGIRTLIRQKAGACHSTISHGTQMSWSLLLSLMSWWNISTKPVKNMLVICLDITLWMSLSLQKAVMKISTFKVARDVFRGVLLGILTHHFQVWVRLAKDDHLTRADADKFHNRLWESPC